MASSRIDALDKSGIRLLKLLSKAGNPGVPFIRRQDDYSFTLIDREFVFPAHVVEACLRRVLACIVNSRMALSAEGRACLQRVLYPDIAMSVQHSQISQKTVRINGGLQTVDVNENESPLARLFMRKTKGGVAWINELEFRAGEKLREDFEKSRLQPRISANWVASVASAGRNGNAGADISDFALDARRRIEDAIAAMGPDLAGVALDMCCFLKGLETIERERSWPPRSAKLMVRTALRELVRHYGLNTRSAKAVTTHWGAPDFRPAL